MAIAIQSPCLDTLGSWLSGFAGEPLPAPVQPPARGRWILCGYGRFGKAMYRHLSEQDLKLTVIEATPHLTGLPKEGVVQGRGTEAVTLEEAGIEGAVGLVAGTDNDVDNLSIIMTALELNRSLFVVARQNHGHNQILFDRVGAHVVMLPSKVIANRIRVRLGTPLLSEFMTFARYQDDAWACELVSRIGAFAEGRVPRRGHPVTIGDLLRDPRERDQPLPVIVLLLQRSDTRIQLPEPERRIRAGDRLLLCGRPEASRCMEWTIQNMNVLRYVLSGEIGPSGPIWRWLARHLGRNGAPASAKGQL
jgi:Trk K+ transport system NAD-binding subunit